MSADRRDAVVVPTVSAPAGHVCVRSIGRQGIDVIVASEKPNVPAATSRYCTESVSLPSSKADLLAYRDALLDLARRPEVRTILPIRPEDSYVFSRYADMFAPYVSLVVPPFETLRRVHDRKRLAEEAVAAGVPVPRTWSFDEVTDWSGRTVIKSRYNILADAYVDGVSPDSYTVVKTVRHVSPGDTQDPTEVVETWEHVPIVQEFVEHDTMFVFGALYDRGEAVATFQHRQVRGNSYTGGGGVYRKSVDIPELERVGRQLLDHLEWHGLACIEYMQDTETGEFVLVEINPRFWQSLATAVRAGADFPWFYWLLATGQADAIDPRYDVGVGTHLLYGELGYLMSILHDDSPLVERPSLVRTLGSIVVSCLTDPHFDFFSLDDPGPFFSGLRSQFS